MAKACLFCSVAPLISIWGVFVACAHLQGTPAWNLAVERRGNGFREPGGLVFCAVVLSRCQSFPYTPAVGIGRSRGRAGRYAVPVIKAGEQAGAGAGGIGQAGTSVPLVTGAGSRPGRIREGQQAGGNPSGDIGRRPGKIIWLFTDN